MLGTKAMTPGMVAVLGGFFAPKERERFRTVRAVGGLAALLVVIALLVMVTKPGGYS